MYIEMYSELIVQKNEWLNNKKGEMYGTPCFVNDQHYMQCSQHYAVLTLYAVLTPLYEVVQTLYAVVTTLYEVVTTLYVFLLMKVMIGEIFFSNEKDCIYTKYD